MNKLKNIFFICILMTSFNAFAQIKDRDVPYTKELFALIEGYFDHTIQSHDHAEQLYLKAIETCPASYDEYQKETHLSRCDYYFGMWVIETFDLTSLEHALDDTSVEFVDPVERNKIIKAEAMQYFDKSIEHALKAMKIRGENASDAMVIYTQAVSANCTVRPIAYVLGNGLKISQYAKKALKVDPTNGTACFSYHAQDAYAPGIFGNANRGRKFMTEYLEDENLVKEKFDLFNFTCAIAYTYYRQNKFEDALVYYKKCQEYFPGNYAIKDLINKCNTKIAEKNK